MKRTIIIAVFLTIFASYFAIAQEESQIQYNINKKEFPTLELQNRVGVYASHFSGYGLSYQHQFLSGVSLKTQLLAFGKINDEEDSENMLIANWGLDLQFDVFKNNSMRYYGLIGSFYHYKEDQNVVFSTGTYKEINRGFNVGIGGGAEIKVMDRITACIEGGYYGRFSNNDEFKQTRISSGNYVYEKVKNKPKEFNFGAGIGVFFAF